MSDLSSRGWDREDDPRVVPLVLCPFHQQTTERVSTLHANTIARQAPCCVRLNPNLSDIRQTLKSVA